jgi:hypothetical protein
MLSADIKLNKMNVNMNNSLITRFRQTAVGSCGIRSCKEKLSNLCTTLKNKIFALCPTIDKLVFKNLFEKNSNMPVKGKSYSEKLQLLKQLVDEYDLSNETQKELFKSRMFEVIKELKEHEIQIPITYIDNRITVKQVDLKRRDRTINLRDI